MRADTATKPFDSALNRVFNAGTVLGLTYVPVAAFLLLWLIAQDAPNEVATIFLVYFLVTYVASFVLLRLLPYRGLKAALFASPFVLAGALAMWWGGLGVAAAIIAAIVFPNRFD